MRRDLKLTLILAPAVAVPLFLALAYLWNPHGDLGSEALAIFGLVGLFPYMYIASELRVALGGATFPLAVLAQLCWTAVWVFLTIRACRYIRYLTSEHP